MKNTTKQSTSNCSANILENLLEINWNSMEPNKELEEALEKKFLTPQKFAIEIENLVSQEEMNYIFSDLTTQKDPTLSNQIYNFYLDPHLYYLFLKYPR